MKFHFFSEQKEKYVVFKLQGSPLTAGDFMELLKAVEVETENHSPNVLLDLKGVAVINSEGLTALIKMMTRCRNQGGDLFIVNISDKISQVLLLTKLNSVLNIVPSAELAEEQFNRS